MRGWSGTGWAVAGIVAVVLWLWGSQQARRADVARGEASAARVVAEGARRRADALAAQVRVDTVRAVAWRTRWDSVRVSDTVRRTDTLRQTVTVYVPRDVADSVIGACTDAWRSCGLALAARTDERDAVARERDAWRRAAQGCRVIGLPCPVVTIGAGVTLSDGQLRIGPTLTFGVPIRF